MSIINQMLRDLDARQASTQERAGLPSGLRTLPPEPRRRAQPWWLLAIGLIAGAVAAWFFSSQSAPPPVTLSEKTAAPQPAPAPAAPPAAPVETSVIAESAPSPPPALASAAEASAPTPQAAPTPAANAKPAVDVKRQAPVTAPAAKTIAPPSPAPTSERPRPAAPVAELRGLLVDYVLSERPRPAAPVAEPVAEKAAAPSAGEARIDKQPKAPPTYELAEAEYRKGLQAVGQGDPASALSLLRRALEFDPQHAKARQALLAVLANSQQWAEVKQVAQAGLALDPTRTGWATLLARLQYEEGAVDTALVTLEKHVAHAANDADFHALFAFILHKNQRHPEAAQHYQAALRLRPGEGRWWFGLGLALEASGRVDEARAAYAKARETGKLPSEMKARVEEKLSFP